MIPFPFPLRWLTVSQDFWLDGVSAVATVSAVEGFVSLSFFAINIDLISQSYTLQHCDAHFRIKIGQRLHFRSWYLRHVQA